MQTTPVAIITERHYRRQGEIDVLAEGGRRKQGSAAYPWWKLQWKWGCWGYCGWRWSHCSCRRWQGLGWKWSLHVKKQWQVPADKGKNTWKLVSPVNTRAQIRAPLSTHIFDQLKSDLMKETSTLKPREGNQGLPLKTGRQPGSLAKERRGTGMKTVAETTQSTPRNPRDSWGGQDGAKRKKI